MNPLTNPYAPSAGFPSSEIAGCDSILAEATIAIERNRLCKPTQSFLFVGLRGVGKTFLLNEVRRIAENHAAVSDGFEVGTNGSLAQTVIGILRSALQKLNTKMISGPVRRGLRILRSFATTFRIRYGEFEFSIPDLEPKKALRTVGSSHTTLLICSWLQVKRQRLITLLS